MRAELRHKNPADPVELGRRPGHLIWRAQQRAWRLFAEVAGNYGITPVQASVLMVVNNQPGVDQKTLAETISLDRATTGNVVARLEARGLLKRAKPVLDRRARTLYLTTAGAVLNRKLGSVTRRSRERLMRDLTLREQKELIRLLRKILDIRESATDG
jgi:MarR family transcriptional regulator, lower aerobic nicotinate degradation pathway regulator